MKISQSVIEIFSQNLSVLKNKRWERKRGKGERREEMEVDKGPCVYLNPPMLSTSILVNVKRIFPINYAPRCNRHKLPSVISLLFIRTDNQNFVSLTEGSYCLQTE